MFDNYCIIHKYFYHYLHDNHLHIFPHNLSNTKISLFHTFCIQLHFHKSYNFLYNFYKYYFTQKHFQDNYQYIFHYEKISLCKINNDYFKDHHRLSILNHIKNINLTLPMNKNHPDINLCINFHVIFCHLDMKYIKSLPFLYIHYKKHGSYHIFTYLNFDKIKFHKPKYIHYFLNIFPNNRINNYLLGHQSTINKFYHKIYIHYPLKKIPLMNILLYKFLNANIYFYIFYNHLYYFQCILSKKSYLCKVNII